jgi:predicted RNase H-like HicB family nuclease
MKNEFYIAVASLLETYVDAGNSIDYVIAELENAVDEWIESDHPEWLAEKDWEDGGSK